MMQRLPMVLKNVNDPGDVVGSYRKYYVMKKQ